MEANEEKKVNEDKKELSLEDMEQVTGGSFHQVVEDEF